MNKSRDEFFSDLLTIAHNRLGRANPDDDALVAALIHYVRAGLLKDYGVEFTKERMSGVHPTMLSERDPAGDGARPEVEVTEAMIVAGAAVILDGMHDIGPYSAKHLAGRVFNAMKSDNVVGIFKTQSNR